MKHRHSLLLALLLIPGSFALSAPADDDASHKAAANELLQAMQSQRTVDRLADQMGLIADRMNPPGRPLAANPADDAKLRESLRQQARDILKEQLKWETLEPMFAQLYVDTFTEAELKQLTEFYKTPVGQKLIDKQPELAQKFGRITQQKAMTALPIISKELRATVQKYKDEHPTPTPAPSSSPAADAAGSPAASPTMPKVEPVAPPAASASPAASPAP